MTTEQLDYHDDELLATHPVAEPLVAGGRVCHGGFDADGSYISPRTLHRTPAIQAWQDHHQDTFGTELMGLPIETWPEPFPNVEQSRLLLRNGVTEPIVATLTRIGTVEGFGAMLRHVPLPDLSRRFDEGVDGTATAHLGKGLIEAHARDEAGFGDQAGHDQMWFAARDIAFENPLTADESAFMLERMGIVSPAAAASRAAAPQPVPSDIISLLLPERNWPADTDVFLELLVDRLTRILLIEISATHIFGWAETLLSDPDLVAGDGEAARLVSYIRADESPHVEYLSTVLTEIRDRTVVGESGKRHAGTDLVASVWEAALEDSLGARRNENLSLTRAEIERAVAGRPGAGDLMEELWSLGSVHPGPDGTWVTRDAA